MWICFFWGLYGYPPFSPATDLLSTETMAHEHREYMTLFHTHRPGYNVLRSVFAPSRILTRDTGIDSRK